MRKQHDVRRSDFRLNFDVKKRIYLFNVGYMILLHSLCELGVYVGTRYVIPYSSDIIHISLHVL